MLFRAFHFTLLPDLAFTQIPFTNSWYLRRSSVITYQVIPFPLSTPIFAGTTCTFRPTPFSENGNFEILTSEYTYTLIHHHLRIQFCRKQEKKSYRLHRIESNQVAHIYHIDTNKIAAFPAFPLRMHMEWVELVAFVCLFFRLSGSRAPSSYTVVLPVGYFPSISPFFFLSFYHSTYITWTIDEGMRGMDRLNWNERMVWAASFWVCFCCAVENLWGGGLI